MEIYRDYYYYELLLELEFGIVIDLTVLLVALYLIVLSALLVNFCNFHVFI